MLFGIANNENSASLASKLRLRRNRWFAELVEGIERPMSVLDVGGRDVVWQTIGFAGDPSVHITLANVEPTQTSYTNIRSVTADARDLNQFADGQFDVVYSNSVIEHVGDFEDMRRMANEIQRVGKRYFVQTPYRYFPIEPHFLFPFFQFLPRLARVMLARCFPLGWMGRYSTWDAAERAVDSVNLLSINQFQQLFPGATIRRETLGGMTKSIVAYRMDKL
jgi:SAM-dependent methyltransferase